MSMGPILNLQNELIEAIAERMGISVDDAAEIVSMVENNVTTHPQSAPTFPSVDTSDTFFLEGDEPSPTTETTLPVETSVVHSIGRYHELGTLGVGGMGKVYKVLDPSLNRTLALKVIHPNLMEIPALVSRFVEEAQIQANLQHPNIVPIHEIGRLEDNRPYFTMRMVQDDPYSAQIEAVHKASSATQWLPTANGTTFRDLINVFHQVCVTVAFAHAQGVIHRDLKPDNILIGRFGQVLVVDWGLAKFMGVTHEDEGDVEYFDTRRPQVGRNKTLIGSVAGTPAYMSPEQARGETKEVGLPTDVYALGAILYEILGGRAPFDGKSSAEILEQVRKHGPKDKLLLDKIPPPLRALCQSAMERNQSDRTLSAHALAQGLKDWLEGAEKRDKGLKELEIAREVLADVQRLEIQAAAEWKQASSRIQSEGAESIGGWESWDNNKATQVKIRGLREDHRRVLQGALVHAPDLEEAHNALAQLVLIDIVRAHALGNLRAEGVLVQQFTGHLDHLTPLVREKLESQLEIGRADPIAGRRMRQGAIIGRQSQRQSIGEHFGSGDRLITLLGTAGVGKTRLALEVAEDLLDLEYKVIFCDLTEATDAMGVGRRLARAMDVRLRDVDPMAHLCEILAAQRTLLILDNLEQIQTIIGPLVTEWIGNTNHLLILATSRLRLMVESETVVAIQPLALLESVELFVTRGQTADQRFELTPDNRIQVCQIVRQLDGLPLAIELAAARLKLLTLDEIGTHLENRFGLLRSHGKESRALDAALDWSWSLLEPWAKAALSQASLFQGGFNLAAATGVIQNSEFKEAPEIFDVLGGLVDNSLLRLEHSDAGVRYSLLESIRAYANNKLGDPKEGAPSLWGPRALTRAQQNHAAYFSRFGTPTTLRALKGFKSSNQWDELFLELDNLVAAIYYGTPESSPLCCLAALKVLGMKGPVTLGVDIATQVMKMPGLNGRAYRLLEIERGKCLRISGRMGEARSMVHSLPPMQMVSVEAKSDTLDSAQNPLSREAALVEAARLLELGNIEKDESNYAGAEQCYIKALAIFQKYGERADEGEALGNLGIIYRSQSQYDRAIEHYNQALDIAREIGNKRSEGINLGNLGDVFVEKRQLDKAEEALRQSIFLSDEACPPAAGAFRASLALLLTQQDQFDETHALLDIGEPQVVTFPIEHSKFLCKKGRVQFLVGEPGAAQNSLDQAKVLSNEHKFGDNPEVTEAIDELATLFRSSDEPEEPAGDEREDALIEAARLQVLGTIEQEESKYFEAEQCFRRSLEIYLKYRDRHGEASVIGNLGNVYREKGQLDRAVDYYTQAVDIASKIGSQQNEGVHLGNLGGVYREKGQHDRAVAYYSQAIAISIEIGDKSTEGINLGNLGNTYKVQGLYDRAVEHYKQAIAIGREVGNRRSEGINLGNLGDVFVEMGQIDKAEETFRKAISICDQSLPPAAGAFRASLALLLAQKGQLDESQELLKVGEPQVTTYPAEHAKFLSKKGQAQFLTGAPEAAVESHNEANEIADEYKLSDDFEVAQAIEALTSLLKSSVTPDPTPDEGREDALIEAVRLMELGNIDRAESKYAEAERCYLQAVEIYQKYGDRSGEGEAIGAIGSVYRQQGQNRRAVEHYTQAIDIAREIGDNCTEGIHLGNLGIVYQEQGQLDRAVEHLTQAIDIARETGNKRVEGITLGNLGGVYKAQGQYDWAADHYTHALNIAREIGNKYNEGLNLGNLGVVYQEQGQYDQAVEHLTQAIDIARVVGNKRTESSNLGNLGVVYQEQGKHDRAVEHYNQAINIAREIGNKLTVSINLGNLGDAFVKMGQIDKAEETFRRAILIGDEAFPIAGGVFRGSLALLLAQQDQIKEAQALLETGEPLVENHPNELAKFLCKTGQVQLLAGAPEAAQKALDQAKAIAAKHKFGHDGEVAEAIAELTALLGSPDDPDDPEYDDREDALIEAARLMELGSIERAESKYAEAERCYQGALAIFQKHGDRAGEGATIGNLGNVYQNRGQHDLAIEHYNLATDIVREAGDKRSEGNNLGNLGAVYRDQGQYDLAAEHLTQAIDIAREIGDKRFEGLHLGNLGDVFVKIAQLDKAEEAFRKSILIGDEAFPIAGGVFRGSLALLLAQKEQLDEAQALLETGEPLVENHPNELAKFLCKKGQVQLLAGDAKAAQKSLDQVKAIAAKHKFGDDGEVAEAIAGLTAHLGSPDEPDEPPVDDREYALIEAARLLELGAIEQSESNYAEAEGCFRKAREIFQKHGDRTGEGEAIGNLGNVYQEQGKHDWAIEHFTQAINISREFGNKGSEGIHLGNLGTVYQHQGQHDRAINHYTQAIDIAREIGDKRSEGVQLGNLGGVYRQQGRHDKAVEHYTQAIEIAKEVGNKSIEGTMVGNLGLLYREQGQHDKAVEYYTLALDIFRAIGNKRLEGIFLGNLGDMLSQQNRLEEAEDAFRKSISITDETFPPAAGAFRGSLALLLAQQGQFDEAQALLKIGEPQVATHPSELAKFLCKKGQVQRLADEPEAAQNSLDQAKAIATEHNFGDDGEVAQAINDLADLLNSPGESKDDEREDALIEAARLLELGAIEEAESKYSEAERCYLKSIVLFQQHGDRAGEGEALGNLGNVYKNMGELDQATKHYTQAVEIAREIGDKSSEGAHLGNLGIVFKNRGDLTRAIKLYMQALDISREIGNKRVEGILLANLGNVYKNKGELVHAAELFTQAIGIAGEIGDKRTESINLGNLGNFFKNKGELEHAVELLTQAIDIAEEIGDKRSEGSHLGNLGEIWVQQGRLEEAEGAFRKAILIGDGTFPIAAGAFRASLALLLAQNGQGEEAQDLIKIGEIQVATYPPEQVKFLCKKGQVQLLAGAPEAALKSLGQAKLISTEHKLEKDGEVAQEIGALEALLEPLNDLAGEEREDALIEAARIMELGDIELAESKYAEAKHCYLSALEIFQKHDDRAGEGEAIGNLGTVYQEQGQYNRAFENYTQSIDIAREIGNKRTEGIHLGNLGNVFREQGQHDRAAEHYTQALDIAREIGNKRTEGIHLGCLGLLYKNQGQHDLAVEHYTQSIDIAREIGDKRSEGIHLGNLGGVCREQKQHDRAVEHFTQAIDIAREIGDKRFESINLNCLGIVYQEQGQHDQAVEYFTQAIDIAKEIGNKRFEGINLGNLGDTFVKIAQLDKAEGAFSKAILMCDEILPPAAGAFRGSLALLLARKNKFDETQSLLEVGEPQVAIYPLELAKFLCKKGQVQLLAGESRGAQEALDQSKAIATEHKFGADGEVAQAINELTALLGSPDEPDEPDEPDATAYEEREDALIEAARLMELGDIELAESIYAEAEHCYLSALEIFQKHGDRAGEGDAIGNLGNVYQEQGQYDRAASHYTQAIDIARDIGNKRTEGIHLGNLGIVYRQQGHHDQAASHYTQAIDITREIGDKRSEGVHLGNLGIVYRVQGQHDRAIEHYTQTIDIAKEIGDKSNEGIYLGNLGIVYHERGQHDLAVEYFTQAIQIAREIGDKRGEGINLGNLGDTFVKIAQLDKAEDAFQKAILINDQASPPAAGVFRGSLALLLAQKGQRDDAQTLLEIGEPQVATYPSELAKFLCKKGQVQLLAGEPEAAHKALDQAKAIATEHKFGADGDVAEAINELTALLGSSDKVRDELIEAERLVELGRIEFTQSDLPKAEAYLESAVKLFKLHDDQAGVGLASGILGEVYRSQGRMALALETVIQAISTLREVGDKRNEGMHLGNLGNIYQQLGELERAMKALTQAVKVARLVGDRRSEGAHLGNIGLIYQHRGEIDRALEHYTLAVDIQREVGDKRTVGMNLGHIGNCYRLRGDSRRAIEFYTQSLEIAREIGLPRLEGISLGNIGDIQYQQSRFDEAEGSFRASILICDEACPPAAGAFRASLALLLSQNDRFDEAQALLEIGEPQVATYPNELIKFVCKKGQVELLLASPEAAQKSVEQAEAVALECKLDSKSESAQAIRELVLLLDTPSAPSDAS
jgi:tetratricopeptide (TPR) repeat protein/serine/threonine protein kinase